MLRLPWVKVQRHWHVICCNGALLMTDSDGGRSFKESCWYCGRLPVGVVHQHCSSLAEPEGIARSSQLPSMRGPSDFGAVANPLGVSGKVQVRTGCKSAPWRGLW